MGLKLSEVLAEIGDDNYSIQILDQAMLNLELKKGYKKYTFGSQEPFNGNGTIKQGIVIWLDRDQVKEIIQKNKEKDKE